MTREELVVLARAKNIRVGNMLNENIIRQIQRDEGFDECFATDKAGQCQQKNCLWQRDCFAHLYCFGTDLVGRCYHSNCLWFRDCLRLYHLNHNLTAPLIPDHDLTAPLIPDHDLTAPLIPDHDLTAPLIF